MISVSLFSGCGGLDFGFEAAGCDVVLRTDFDRHCCNTLRLNSDRPVLETPIEELSGADLRQALGSSRRAVDIVIGGPPCQPFSKAAYWSKGDTLRLKDPRANTLNEYFRVIQELQPKAFLLENVHGISYTGKEEGFRFILNRIRQINRVTGTDYRPVWRVLNAADYGVPQLRVRFVLVALRNGEEFRFPDHTHAAEDDLGPALLETGIGPYTTAWDAIGAISPDPDENLTVAGKWGRLLPSIPEGENYLWHTDRKGGLPLFGWRTRYWTFLLKLAKNKPSWTIQAQPGSAIGPFHWSNRRLSRRELAAIQTFPKSFKISGPRVEIQRQIGNAVPSLLAEVLARSVIAQVAPRRFAQPPTLAIQHRQDTPPAESVASVPREYLSLVGSHAAHPGTGKGPSYQPYVQESMRLMD